MPKTPGSPGTWRPSCGSMRRRVLARWSVREGNSGSARAAASDAILLNGGVFNSSAIAGGRLLEVVSSWWLDTAPLRLLATCFCLELAVARGAAYYGLIRQGIWENGSRGGAARAFYVGIAPQKEGLSPRAVCLIPRGQEEGQTVDLKSQPFTLSLRRPVQFPLFSTTADRIDRPGDAVEVEPRSSGLPPIHTLFKGADAKANSVPVHLQANLTELGTLELWCVSNPDGDPVASRVRVAGRRGSRRRGRLTESMPPILTTRLRFF